MQRPVRAPGPKGSWLLGSLPEFLADPHAFFLRCTREFGPVVRIRLVHNVVHLVAGPEANGEVLLGNYRNFVKHKQFFGRTRAVFGKGLISNEGESWRRQRKLIAPGFHRERIAAYARLMCDYARQQLEDWGDGGLRNLYVDMHAITARIVSHALFDEAIAGEAFEIGKAMSAVSDATAERLRQPLLPPDWVPTPANLRYRRAVASIDRLVARFIAAHRQDLESRNSLLAMLMQTRDESGRPMDEKQLRDEAVTLFAAGHETTAAALSWTLYLLTQHADWQRRLQALVDSVAPRGHAQVEDLPALKEIEWAVLEGMRLFPPVPLIARQAVAECSIGGYRVPADSSVLLAAWNLHRDAHYFTDPDRFDPLRWADGLAERLPRHVYLPFGGGPRICVGERFAMMEMVLLLASFLRQFDFEYAGTAPPVTVAAVTLAPKGGIPMLLRRRSTAQGAAAMPAAGIHT